MAQEPPAVRVRVPPRQRSSAVGVCISTLKPPEPADLVAESVGAECAPAYDGRHSSRVLFVTRAPTPAGEAGPAAAR